MLDAAFGEHDHRVGRAVVVIRLAFVILSMNERASASGRSSPSIKRRLAPQHGTPGRTSDRRKEAIMTPDSSRRM